MRRTRQWSTPSELARIDKALTLVGGSFVAAAKLTDTAPDRFRALIRGNPALRAKWGRARGPGIKLGFHVEPYSSRAFAPLSYVKECVQELSRPQLAELAEWLVQLQSRELSGLVQADPETGKSRRWEAIGSLIPRPFGSTGQEELAEWRKSIGIHPDGLHGAQPNSACHP